MKKRAVIVVSFGTSYDKAIKNAILPTEKVIEEALDGYKRRRAFTSQFIINKLSKKSIYIDDVEQALYKLKEEGYKEILVQPLHIIPGYEYEEIKEAVYDFKNKNSFIKVVLGEPMIFKHEDYKKAVEALKTQLPLVREDRAVVLMGHGTNHNCNACYYCLQSFLDKECNNVYIANVEGMPKIGDIITSLKEKRINQVMLMPFMLVAGDHAFNDMAGEEDSWKSMLQEEGIEVELYLKGLGENPAFRKIYAEKAKNSANMGFNDK